MPAKIDFSSISEVTETFPTHGEWRTFRFSELIRNRGVRAPSLDWSATNVQMRQAGVYGFFFPAEQFARSGRIQLHGPQQGGVNQRIELEFLPKIKFNIVGARWVLLYVGKSYRLRERWVMHLGNGRRANGRQVRAGLFEAGVCDEANARGWIIEHSLMAYRIMSGIENAANRDIAECSLHARYHPAFNVKVER